MHLLRIATRKSALATVQAKMVIDRIERLIDVRCEIVGITTKGDRIQDRSLSAIGGDGVFVKELQSALLEDRADLAVHSMKDLPTDLPPQLCAACIPEREDARDLLVSKANAYDSLAALPAGSVVGTSSLRRGSQLRALRPDIVIKDLRGNVDTRIDKVFNGDYDAAVLALAGVKRLGWLAALNGGCALSPSAIVPAVGQGALYVECRVDDGEAIALLAPLNHPPTALAVAAERAFLRQMGGGCAMPIGCHVTFPQGGWRLNAFVGAPDGSEAIRRTVEGASCGETELLERARNVADEMLNSGGRRFLELSKSSSVRKT